MGQVPALWLVAVVEVRRCWSGWQLLKDLVWTWIELSLNGFLLVPSSDMSPWVTRLRQVDTAQDVWEWQLQKHCPQPLDIQGRWVTGWPLILYLLSLFITLPTVHPPIISNGCDYRDKITAHIYVMSWDYVDSLYFGDFTMLTGYVQNKVWTWTNHYHSKRNFNCSETILGRVGITWMVGW